jgi:hypothetical protein
MVKPNIKYWVTLTGEERDFLQKLIKKGKTAGYRIRHAQILLAPDGIPANAHLTGAAIGGAYGVRQQAAGVLRKRFAEEGFGAEKEGGAATGEDRRGSGSANNRGCTQRTARGRGPLYRPTRRRDGGYWAAYPIAG